MCDPREADYAWWTCTQEEELEQRQVRRKTIFLGANDNPEELAVSKGTSEKAMVATGVVRNPQKDSFLGLLSEIIWLILNWIKRWLVSQKSLVEPALSNVRTSQSRARKSRKEDT